MNIELVTHIKNLVIAEIKKEYFLVSKINSFDHSDKVKNESFILHVVDVVCDYFKLQKSCIVENGRERPYPETRFIIFNICREVPDRPIPFGQIGACFNKDHATVMHGCKKAIALSEVHKLFKFDLEKLKEMIKKDFYSGEKD